MIFTLPVILSMIGLALGATRLLTWLVDKWWGATKLKKLEAWLEAQRLALEAERAKLAVETATIDAQPDKPADEVAADLTKDFTKK